LLTNHPRNVRLFLWPPLPTIFSGCWGHHADGSPVDPLEEVVSRPSAWRRRSVPDPRGAAPARSSRVVNNISPSPPSLLERRLAGRTDLDLGALRHLRDSLTLAIPSRQVITNRVMDLFPPSLWLISW
jgi:hypothetical protein